MGFYQEGAPKGTPTLVTRLVQPAYDERQCTYMFADEYKDLKPGQVPVPDVAATNKAYDGWFVTTQHLFFANGHRAYFFTLPSSLPVSQLLPFATCAPAPVPPPRARARRVVSSPLATATS